MRKAGYAVRMLTADQGSYEEGPPTLIDMLKRDRRWCQGNMQHFWLLFAKGWHPMSRLNFAHGVLSYVSSPLWFLFLVFSTILAAFPDKTNGPQREQIMLAGQLLLWLTATLIFLPKVVILTDELLTGRLFKPIKLRILAFISSMAGHGDFQLHGPGDDVVSLALRHEDHPRPGRALGEPAAQGWRRGLAGGDPHLLGSHPAGRVMDHSGLVHLASILALDQPHPGFSAARDSPGHPCSPAARAWQAFRPLPNA